MESTLDHSAVERYSRTFSSKVLSEAYTDHDQVSGQDILSLSPVKQVNFFVIKALFDQWQQEMDRLKSPYFNYHHEEVQLALEEFMNTLSQHISVAKPQLEPLLEVAVRDTITLMLSPIDYYQRTLSSGSADPLYAEDVKTWSKYVKINKEPLEKLLERAHTSDDASVSLSEAQQLLEQVAQSLSNASKEEYLRTFATVEPVSVSDLTEVEAPEPAHSIVPDSVPVQEDAPQQEEATDDAEPIMRTLNDELNAGQSGTLADMHRQQKIANIKSYIGVNQRFMFIRELFDSNADEYNKALDELEQQNTYIEAFNHLRQAYAQPHRWKMDSEEVVEFLEIVAKRF